jgi:hypothetical protein
MALIMSTFNLLLIDDKTTSINSFNNIDLEDIIRSIKSSESRNLERCCADFVSSQMFQDSRYLILDKLENRTFTKKSFHISNFDAYLVTAEFFGRIPPESEDIYVLILDIETCYVEDQNIDLLRNNIVRNLANTPGKRYKYPSKENRRLVSYSLLAEFIALKLKYGFVLLASQYGAALDISFEDLYEPLGIINYGHIKEPNPNIYIQSLHSVYSSSAEYKICEALLGVAKKLHDNPIDLIRYKSASENGWFSMHNDDVNHTLSDETKAPTKWQFKIHLKLTQEEYLSDDSLYCVHLGLKNIGLNDYFKPPSLYSILLLASAWNPSNCLTISAENALPTDLSRMPERMHNIRTDSYDFAESIYRFYKLFLMIENNERPKVVTAKYSDNEGYLILKSNQNVMRLFDLVRGRLENPEKYESNKRLCSRYLAECIHYGRWGLMGRNERIKEPGLFDIIFSDNEIKISWQKPQAENK